VSKVKGFIGETIIYGFGNVFSRLFAMLLIPLYAEYLGKMDYSNLVMLQSLFSFLTFLLALNSGVFYYYYEYESFRYRRIIFTSWFYFQVVVAAALLLLLFVFSPLLMKLFLVTETNSIDLKWCVILMGLQLFPYIINITNINYFRIERRPKSVVWIVLLEATFTLLLVYLSLGFFKFGLVSVVISQIIARFFVNIAYHKSIHIYVSIKLFSQKLVKKLVDFSWPFIVSSLFTVIIVGVDKFIGAKTLTDKTDVAILALAMQLALPITVLADMIRMALGPFVMSIRKDSDAEKNYQKIYDLTIFSSSVVLIVLVSLTPLLTVLLADNSYIKVVYIIPLLGFANVLSLAANQFCVSFSLVKKNVFVLYAFIIAGVSTILINSLFMKQFGFIVSGFSQLVSYLLMFIFLFFLGRKVANLRISILKSIILLFILAIYSALTIVLSPLVTDGHQILHLMMGCAFIAIISATFMLQQKINLRDLLHFLKRKKKFHY